MSSVGFVLLQAQPGGADLSFFLMMGAIFLIFYMLVIRPQQKKQKEPQMPSQPTVCPSNTKWLRAMLQILPPGLRGKLAPFESCLDNSSEIETAGPGRHTRRPNVIHPVIR